MEDWRTYVDLLAVVASVASAAGCLLAVRASRRAALAAEVAQAALLKSDRRASLRELRTTASAVLSEGHRLTSLTGQVVMLHRSLAMASEESSREQVDGRVAEAEKKRSEINILIDGARAILDAPAAFEDASAEDIDEACLRQALAMSRIKALGEELDREHAIAETHRGVLLEQMEKMRLASRY